MVDITSNIEWNDNIYVKKFVKDNRVGGEVQSLTIKVKVYKKDALGTIAGDGNMLSYNDHSMTTKTKVGTNYLDFDNGTPLVEKNFTYSVPESQRTSASQTTVTLDSEGVKLYKEYFTKCKAWTASYKVSDDFATCYNSLWTDLEALDVSW